MQLIVVAFLFSLDNNFYNFLSLSISLSLHLFLAPWLVDFSGTVYISCLFLSFFKLLEDSANRVENYGCNYDFWHMSIWLFLLWRTMAVAHCIWCSFDRAVILFLICFFCLNFFFAIDRFFYHFSPFFWMTLLLCVKSGCFDLQILQMIIHIMNCCWQFFSLNFFTLLLRTVFHCA